MYVIMTYLPAMLPSWTLWHAFAMMGKGAGESGITNDRFGRSEKVHHYSFHHSQEYL